MTLDLQQKLNDAEGRFLGLARYARELCEAVTGDSKYDEARRKVEEMLPPRHEPAREEIK
jgi:hypothetical protein